jgi:hypothetical protein
MEYAPPVMPFRLRNIGAVIAAIPLAGRRGDGGEYAVVCERWEVVAEGYPTDRAYGTQTARKDERGQWVATGNGNYDLTRNEAILDMIARSGFWPGA